MRTIPHVQTLLAGLAGGFAWTIVSFLTFGYLGRYTIFNPAVQSAKFMDVFVTYDPQAIAVTYPWFYLMGFAFFGVGHSYIYHWLYPVLGKNKATRIKRFSLLIIFMSSLYFEIFGPLNLLSEPLHLVALEMIFWTLSILAEVWVLERILGKFHQQVERA